MGEMTDDLLREEENLASLEVPPWDAGPDPRAPRTDREILDLFREYHTVASYLGERGEEWCTADGQTWPCDVARLLSLAETGAAAREWAMAGDKHTPVIHIYPDGSGTVYLQAVSGDLEGDRYDFDDWRLPEAVAAALWARDDE